MQKAVRQNDIQNKILKLCDNTVISPFLCNIFNSCIHQVQFLNSLKIEEVVRVFKTEDSNLLTHYCPFPILSQISKIFKKLISVFNKINPLS